MSKLGEDGKPIRREDGKILKGPNYKPADPRSLGTKLTGTAEDACDAAGRECQQGERAVERTQKVRRGGGSRARCRPFTRRGATPAEVLGVVHGR